MIRTVDLDAIKNVISHENSYEAVRHGLVRLGAGEVATPDELALLVKPAGDVHVKGAYISDSQWIVFKVAAGSFPGAPNSGCSFLLNAQTGAPTFIFDDGGWLTEMRTAAAGAVAADLLANPGPLNVAVLGTGVQARFQLAALRSRRYVESVNIWGRTKTKADELAHEVSGTAFQDVGDAVAGANLVITTTSATAPVLQADHLSPGAHITAMGSDTTGKRELADDVMEIASIIAADDVATCGRVGELQHTPQHVDRAVSMADLASGKSLGRRSPEEITVADLCGIGTYDAAIACLTADLLSPALLEEG